MKNSIINCNKKRSRITSDELRKFDGFENITDEEAEEYINSIQQFSILAYEIYMKERSKKKVLKEQQDEKSKPENG